MVSIRSTQSTSCAENEITVQVGWHACMIDWWLMIDWSVSRHFIIFKICGNAKRFLNPSYKYAFVSIVRSITAEPTNLHRKYCQRIEGRIVCELAAKQHSLKVNDERRWIIIVIRKLVESRTRASFSSIQSWRWTQTIAARTGWLLAATSE